MAISNFDKVKHIQGHVLPLQKNNIEGVKAGAP